MVRRATPGSVKKAGAVRKKSNAGFAFLRRREAQFATKNIRNLLIVHPKAFSALSASQR
jgi:hypothetical protein